jgi:DNA-binding NtrC family response regulator
MAAVSAKRGRPDSGVAVRKPGSSHDGGPQRVAIVADDEPLVRQLVCSVLARQGWRTIEAADGIEALGLSIDAPVDLLITDYEMPSISGLALANVVSRRTPGLPILLISGVASLAEVASSRGYHFLQKPFELGDLVAEIRGLSEQEEDCRMDEPAAKIGAREQSRRRHRGGQDDGDQRGAAL